MTESLKILVADDNDTDRLILSTILKKEGHEVVQAVNGREAVDLFSSSRPHLVLLDAIMPELDGSGAAREIKNIAGEDLVPIIFLTSLTDAESLASCLDAGGDDFLSKPYQRVILKAKIHAFQRMLQMHQTLQRQRDQIAQNNTYLLEEQRVAKAVFDNVAHSGSLNAPNLKYLLSPLAVFNGDVLLAAYKPSGGMYILLGDFTGHGLPAAIGAMPLAEIFYGMSAKGFGLSDILREINLKLKSIFLVNVFCCSGMMGINFKKQTMTVWLGGLPDCYLIRANGEMEIFESKHLPVGVLGPKQFDDTCVEVQMSLGDRFYLWSDGIHEARNENAEMFGEERLKNLFINNTNLDDLFESINEDVTTYIDQVGRNDDITMLEFMMIDSDMVHADQIELEMGAISGPTDWSMTYQLGPATLRDFNPLPLLLHLLMEVPGLRPHSGTLYIVLAELYSNALEHGVIGLDSKLKSNPPGFVEYYEKREEGLAGLYEGWVKFSFDHLPSEGGGRLRFLVEDSGAGFDYNNDVFKVGSNDENLHGRGIQLLKTLCQDIQYSGRGNEVEVFFEWQREA
jgi:DNA-binding response OmpR family regulator